MKEYFVRKWKTWTKGSRVFAVLWTSICVGLFLYTLIHPRPWNILITVIVLGGTIVLWTKVRDAISYVAISLLLIPVIYIFVPPYLINMFYTQHGRWEYKGDIKEFKSELPEAFQAFPDKLPKGAKNVLWNVCPGLMQGASFEVLRFEAPLEYIDEVVEEFGLQAQRYVYEVEYYGFPTRFPYESYMTEKETSELYVLHLYEEGDYLRTYGFWVNRSIGEIGFYEE